MAQSFVSKLASAQRATGSALCVGLDPDRDRMPRPHAGGSTQDIVAFCREIVEATRDFASAYKVNFAFFEALGDDVGDLVVVRDGAETVRVWVDRDEYGR